MNVWSYAPGKTEDPIKSKEASTDFSLTVNESGSFWLGGDPGCKYSVRDRDGSVPITWS